MSGTYLHHSRRRVLLLSLREWIVFKIVFLACCDMTDVSVVVDCAVNLDARALTAATCCFFITELAAFRNRPLHVCNA